MYYIYHRLTGVLLHKTPLVIVLNAFDPKIYEVVINP